ncbi:MAG TPA: class I SAM-dependent methyltransferase [Candidatus Desulfovibrio intestinigallinarum]|nr:class I SAM-dependent methyltransferase [Candidatus Desulfovibrio intestinigallinarum]
MHSEQTLRPARPSLLDQLAHAGLTRAFAAARENGVRPLCLDGTAGNGHDSLFLAETAPKGALVLALGVQPAAIAATEKRLALARERLNAAGTPLETDWRCLCRGHEELEAVLRDMPEAAGLPLMAAVFNFGWLPGSDKSCVTRAETSLRAVDAVLERLAPCGCLCLHCYTGHAGGAEEEAALCERLAGLPARFWRVFYGRDLNRPEDAAGGPGRYESLLLAERLPVRRKRSC